MKEYGTYTEISYMTQESLRGNIEKIFDMALGKMGERLLSQVYRDLPECFTQDNMNDRMATRYKVDLVVMSKEEFHRLLLRR